MTVGFVGLGVMGQPMALNLQRAGVPLVVWNRSPGRTQLLRDAGSTVAPAIDAVFDAADTVLLMMANAEALDSVLGRGRASFQQRMAQHTIVHTGTTAPEYSAALDAEIRAAGGRYVEAPVSGSRVPAENAQLVGMVAGQPDAVDDVVPLLGHLCRDVFRCGSPPAALRMKLAVNLFLITMVTGLAEAAHFAAVQGLDMAQFVKILDAGPMASSVSRIKLDKLLADDLSVQASVTDVHMNSRLVADAARGQGMASPLLDISRDLFAEAESLGHGRLDMIAVIRALEARSDRLR